jgi:hypothetical protein
MLLASLFAAACGGATDGGSGYEGGASSQPPYNGATQPAQTSFSAAQVAAANSACPMSMQEGPSVPTVGDYRGQIVGAWWLCGGPPPAGPILVTEDGRWINLVSDGNGGLVPGTAATDQFTYEIDTVFDGQPILDAGPGQVLGAQTTIFVDGANGFQQQLLVSPLQNPTGLDVWLAASEYNDPEWFYVLLGGP